MGAAGPCALLTVPARVMWGWSDFFSPGRHLLCDGSVVSVFLDYMASKASEVPGTAASLKEEDKISKDANSAQPVGSRHRLVPCVVEEGGRLGGHFQALLRELAERGVSRGILRVPASWGPAPPPVAVSHWVGTWRARISTWLHSALSRRLLRTSDPGRLL